MQISVVIITFNEEKNIGRCIDSVQSLADEIVVLDSFSTDRTKEIVLEKGGRFFEHEFDGHIQQKNRAITHATHQMVLSLDADEALDEQLIASILRLKKEGTADGYSMNRLTNYCGKWIRHGGWYPDRKLRLWNKHKGQWGGENPHDKYILEAGCTTQQLNGNILHYSFTQADQHDRQIGYFTDIAAKALFEKGKRASVLRPPLSALFKFLRDYIFKLGFLDGATGYTIASKSAYASYLKYAKLRMLSREHEA